MFYIKKIVRYLLMVIYTSYLRIRNKSKVANSVILTQKTKIAKRCAVHKNVSIANSKIGFGTYIGKESLLSDAKIGAFCSIAENVEILYATHPTKDFVSTHPAFFSLIKQSGFTFVKSQLFDEKLLYDKKFSIIIGNDVWIGSHTLLLGGIKIGDGAVIAAGSVVTKSVEPYQIVGGVPAKIIRSRFTPDQVAFLLKFKWWEKSTLWLKANAHSFRFINTFIKENN